jgi:hypothetical protein
LFPSSLGTLSQALDQDGPSLTVDVHAQGANQSLPPREILPAVFNVVEIAAPAREPPLRVDAELSTVVADDAHHHRL